MSTGRKVTGSSAPRRPSLWATRTTSGASFAAKSVRALTQVPGRWTGSASSWPRVRCQTRTEPSVPAESSRSPGSGSRCWTAPPYVCSGAIAGTPCGSHMRIVPWSSPLTSRERPSVVVVRVSDARRVSETASTLSCAVQSLHSGVTREPDTRAADVSSGVRGRVAA
ncbi:hypothetical protein O1M63_19475 [Streptomyces mirabilis]|nr:hypothetical protein [Streptomyces mirabilis]